MRIALVHPAHMDYRQEIFDKLDDRYDVTFIFTKHGRGQDNVKEKQASIPLKWKSKILRTRLTFGNRDIGMYLLLMKELLFGKYDLILTSTSWHVCWLMSKLCRNKFILITEFWYWKNTSFTRKVLNEFTKYIARSSDSIFAMGTKTYQSYLEFGVSEDKIFAHTQCSVDYSKQTSFDARKKLGLEDKKIILYLGRIVQSKGLDYLIKAFSQLESNYDNIFLIVIGEGPHRNECEKVIDQLKVKNVMFLGSSYGNEKASYYKACDIFVLPSIFYNYSYEPWGLVINEAMAFGKPVIATNAVGASEDLIQNGHNGYVAQEKNIMELYEAMKKILSDSEVLKLMGENSRIIFEEKNDYEKMFKALENAINNS
ncbi:hypothetical protein MSMTP_2497 [Methanosarcina sp. MTP4]|uniref:glycosyltransferase family 4 protein n=1 Tax=Methanosarcina sp. MTP4 TaxID=1434100 RepID=UPI000616066A|nr:glycosyltransferase family 4 protein [Methanosarcina sp. MTP4]AKB25966.1 hypothetical protein MSMTP_2497 [Methanosarcina sp. MTP4]